MNPFPPVPGRQGSKPSSSRRFIPLVELLESRDCPAGPQITSLSAVTASGHQVQVSGTLTADNPGSVTITLSGVAAGSGTANANGTFQLTVPASNLGVVSAVATDAANQSSQPAQATLAADPATVILNSLASAGFPGVTVSGQIITDDPGFLPVTFGGALPGGGVSTDAEGNFTASLTASSFGNATVSTTDEWGVVSTVTVTLTDQGALMAVPDRFSVIHDRALNLSTPGILDNDLLPDGTTPPVVVDQGTGHGTLAVQGDGSLAYTPDPGYTGTDSLTYHLVTGAYSSAPAIVYLDVTNEAPAAGDADYLARPGQTIHVGDPGLRASAADGDSDPLTFQEVTGPPHGTLDFSSDGSFYYTPNAGFVGTDPFTYRVSDGVTTSGTATVTINVYDKAPVAGDDSFDLPAGGTGPGQSASVLANDYAPSASALTALPVQGPAHAAFFNLHPDGTFEYHPMPGYLGQDSFRYLATDGTLASDPATVSLNVTAAPFGHGDAYTLTTSGSVTVSADGGLLSNDYTPDSRPLVAQLMDQPASGSVALNSDGSFTYQPPVGGAPQGPVLFHYRAFSPTLQLWSGITTVTLLNAGQGPLVSVLDVMLRNSGNVRPDNGQPAYVFPEWKPTMTQGQPAVYVRGDMMDVVVQIQTPDATKLPGKVRVRGTGDGLTFDATGTFTSGGRLMVNAKVQLPDTIKLYDPLTFTWQVLPAGADATDPNAWITAGTSTNRVYVTWGEINRDQNGRPFDDLRYYETLLRIGTMGADGDTDKDQAVRNIFEVFQGNGIDAPQVKRLDGTVLTYDADWEMPNDPLRRTTNSLLRTGDGNCESWACFFLDVLRVQGIEYPDWFFVAEPKNAGEWLTVKQWQWTVWATGEPFVNTYKGREPYNKDSGAWAYDWRTAELVKAAGTSPGQGNTFSPSIFNNHALAVITDAQGTTTLYDPSYGMTYTSLSDFDSRAIDYYGTLRLKTPQEQDLDKQIWELKFRSNPAALDLKRDADRTGY
jgi:hypothetical protein